MTQIFQTVLTMSISGSILALLVLGARAIIARRQTVLLTVLFALLIAKLLFPLSIESPASVHNLLSMKNVPLVTQDIQSEIISPQKQISDTNIQNSDTALAINEEYENAANVNEPAAVSTTKKAWQPSALDIAAIIWLAGMAAFGASITIGNIRFSLKLKRNREYTAPGFSALMAQCKKEFGISQHIPVIRASEIHTAAVYGIIRPKLLISPQIFDTLAEQEKRHILMHELSHIKRKDTLTCLVMTILNIVHWFNPIIWIAFLIMRKDIEVMCDAKVLRKIGQHERRSYADTLLHLIKKTSTKNVRLVTALFMSKTSIKRRIIMIAKYKKNSPLYIATALLITIAVAVTGCTTSMPDTAEEADIQKPETTMQPSVNGTETTTETDNTISSELELITTYSFDFSSYAGNEARVENIRKAAHIFNKTIIKSKEDNGFIYDMSITAENGWFEAPSLTWKDYMNVMEEANWAPQASDTEKFETMQIGGGIDLVFGAIYKAFSQADINGAELGFFEDDFSKGGDLVISNGGTDILMQMTIEDKHLIVKLYGEPSLSSDIITPEIEPVLMTSFTLDYSNHTNSSTIHNIEKALGLLNGTIILPGEELSLNEALGPRNAASGWKEAAGISNGAFVMQYGGGVSAVSSALYNAALRAELEIVDSSRHTIMSDYVPGGLDATISTGGPDLVIKNPYDINVTIEGSMNDGIITIDIYGPPRDYTVDYTSALLSTEDEPEMIYYYNAQTTPDGHTIPEGESVPYVKGRTGREFQVYKIWYDSSGKETKKELYYTYKYRPIAGSVYVNAPDPAE